MKIFLDVGAHTGQTLAAAQRWDFDRIVCFEPARVNHAALRKLADARTEIKDFGLWNKNARVPLYNIGTQGASIWDRPNRPKLCAPCSFVRASEWLASNVSPRDTVWMKLNVEGAELDVLTDLMDTGATAFVDFMEVMWDSHKIPEIADRTPAVRARLEALHQPPRVVSSDKMPLADTHTARIDAWLELTGAVNRR